MKPLTIPEALELLKVSKATFYRDMKRGKVSYILDKNNHRTIDINELIRVYGDENIHIEKIGCEKLSHNKTNKYKPKNTIKNNELDIKNKEIELLRKVLDEKNLRISDLNRTLGMLEKQLDKANFLLENLTEKKIKEENNLEKNPPDENRLTKKSAFKWKFWKKNA